MRLGVEVGLDEQEVRDLLDGDRYADSVREDERTAGELGISAVPTFVVDRRLGASGAQPPDALLDLLRRDGPGAALHRRSRRPSQPTSQIAPSRTSTGKVFSARAPAVAFTAPARGLNAPWGPRTIFPEPTS